ncbi:hypothetical protein L249_6363, partial [Ophiocordyceps polyrhachis-furcata BCC 54312]
TSRFPTASISLTRVRKFESNFIADYESNIILLNEDRQSGDDPVPPVNIPDPIPNIPEIEGECGVKICALNYDLASKRKGKLRVINDLRALNSIAVLDAYLMLIPQDIIYKLAGKKIILAINARNYREQFTIISYRGLERATIALIGRSDSSDRCDTLFPASHNGSNYYRNAKHLYSVKDENPMPPLLEEKDAFYDIINALCSNAALICYIPGAFNILADLLSRLPLKAAPEKGDRELEDIWEDNINTDYVLIALLFLEDADGRKRLCIPENCADELISEYYLRKFYTSRRRI